jgi:DNA-binding transcriptional MerR regulator
LKGAFELSRELISKKDLLDITGISYGQLYRWKRKNLIPEEWFIKKSTFTGQETFFPKDKILERIEKIQSMKDHLSLDELAEMFSPNFSNLSLSSDELIKRNIVSLSALQFYQEQIEADKEYNFEKLLNVFILDKLLQSGEINLDEGKMILSLLNKQENIIKQKSFYVIFIRKYGVSSCLLLEDGADCYFEEGTKVVIRLSVSQCMEELKAKLL